MSEFYAGNERRKPNVIFILVILFFLALCGFGIFQTATQGWSSTFGGSIAGDCDERDVYEFDDDCGYYNAQGIFIFYPWVTPGKGGTPQNGKRPTPPKAVQTTKPQYQGKRSSNVRKLSPQKPTPQRVVSRGGK